MTPVGADKSALKRLEGTHGKDCEGGEAGGKAGRMQRSGGGATPRKRKAGAAAEEGGHRAKRSALPGVDQLVPCHLTERQQLALALEESRRAAQAAATACTPPSKADSGSEGFDEAAGGESDADSDMAPLSRLAASEQRPPMPAPSSDDESSAGQKGACQAAPQQQPGSAAGAGKAASGERKQPRAQASLLKPQAARGKSSKLRQWLAAAANEAGRMDGSQGQAPCDQRVNSNKDASTSGRSSERVAEEYQHAPQSACQPTGDPKAIHSSDTSKQSQATSATLPLDRPFARGHTAGATVAARCQLSSDNDEASSGSGGQEAAAATSTGPELHASELSSHDALREGSPASQQAACSQQQLPATTARPQLSDGGYQAPQPASHAMPAEPAELMRSRSDRMEGIKALAARRRGEFLTIDGFQVAAEDLVNWVAGDGSCMDLDAGDLTSARAQRLAARQALVFSSLQQQGGNEGGDAGEPSGREVKPGKEESRKRSHACLQLNNQASSSSLGRSADGLGSDAKLHKQPSKAAEHAADVKAEQPDQLHGLDAATIAEMARRRKQRFGASDSARKPVAERERDGAKRSDSGRRLAADKERKGQADARRGKHGDASNPCSPRSRDTARTPRDPPAGGNPFAMDAAEPSSKLRGHTSSSFAELMEEDLFGDPQPAPRRAASMPQPAAKVKADPEAAPPMLFRLNSFKQRAKHSRDVKDEPASALSTSPPHLPALPKARSSSVSLSDALDSECRPSADSVAASAALPPAFSGEHSMLVAGAEPEQGQCPKPSTTDGQIIITGTSNSPTLVTPSTSEANLAASHRLAAPEHSVAAVGADLGPAPAKIRVKVLAPAALDGAETQSGSGLHAVGDSLAEGGLGEPRSQAAANAQATGTAKPRKRGRASTTRRAPRPDAPRRSGRVAALDSPSAEEPEPGEILEGGEAGKAGAAGGEVLSVGKRGKGAGNPGMPRRSRGMRAPSRVRWSGGLGSPGGGRRLRSSAADDNPFACDELYSLSPLPTRKLKARAMLAGCARLRKLDEHAQPLSQQAPLNSELQTQLSLSLSFMGSLSGLDLADHAPLSRGGSFCRYDSAAGGSSMALDDRASLSSPSLSEMPLSQASSPARMPASAQPGSWQTPKSAALLEYSQQQQQQEALPMTSTLCTPRKAWLAGMPVLTPTSHPPCRTPETPKMCWAPAVPVSAGTAGPNGNPETPRPRVLPVSPFVSSDSPLAVGVSSHVQTTRERHGAEGCRLERSMSASADMNQRMSAAPLPPLGSSTEAAVGADTCKPGADLAAPAGAAALTPVVRLESAAAQLTVSKYHKLARAQELFAASAAANIPSQASTSHPAFQATAQAASALAMATHRSGSPANYSAQKPPRPTSARCAAARPEAAVPAAHTASFQAACSRLMQPMKRMPGGWSAAAQPARINPGLQAASAMQRSGVSQQHIQSTWDDLLARQSLESATVDGLQSWLLAPQSAKSQG